MLLSVILVPETNHICSKIFPRGTKPTQSPISKQINLAHDYISARGNFISSPLAENITRRIKNLECKQDCGDIVFGLTFDDSFGYWGSPLRCRATPLVGLLVWEHPNWNDKWDRRRYQACPNISFNRKLQALKLETRVGICLRVLSLWSPTTTCTRSPRPMASPVLLLSDEQDTILRYQSTKHTSA